MRTEITRRSVLLALAASPLIGVSMSVSPVEATSNVVVFVAAHQDDELLSMGSSIVSHVQAGYRVYVIPATDGQATGARFKVAERLGRLNAV